MIVSDPLCDDLARMVEDYKRHCATAGAAPASTYDWLRWWPAVRQILDILMAKCTPLMPPKEPPQ